MKIEKAIILFSVLVIVSTVCYAQTKETEDKAIKMVIQESYLGGAFNDKDTKAMLKGFDENYISQTLHENKLHVTPLKEWMKELDDWKAGRVESDEHAKDWSEKITAEVEVIGLVNNAAVVKVDMCFNKALRFTSFMSLYKIEGGWKITNSISTPHEG